ncbi:MAG: hypothetical protein GYA50_00900 [Eubacteriaceae bacterium]|nr:hypothetical protein [Eubacteriaceae bacterium]
MNNSDYQSLKQRYNKRIRLLSYFLFITVAMVLANAAITILRIPYDIAAIRIIIPDIMFNYGFNALKNSEMTLAIVLLVGFAIILAVLIIFSVYAHKNRRWAFGWMALFAFAELPLLIIVQNWQSILVHIALIVICIIGGHMCGASTQLDRKMWTF